jgi:hypothetical protein
MARSPAAVQSLSVQIGSFGSLYDVLPKTLVPNVCRFLGVRQRHGRSYPSPGAVRLNIQVSPVRGRFAFAQGYRLLEVACRDDA